MSSLITRLDIASLAGSVRDGLYILDSSPKPKSLNEVCSYYGFEDLESFIIRLVQEIIDAHWQYFGAPIPFKNPTGPTLLAAFIRDIETRCHLNFWKLVRAEGDSNNEVLYELELECIFNQIYS